MDLSRAMIGRSGVWRWPHLALDACSTCFKVDVATFAMAAMSSVAVDSLADPTGALSLPRIAVGQFWVALAIAVRVFVAHKHHASAPIHGKHAEASDDFSVRHRPAPPLSLGWVALLAVITLCPLAMEPILRWVLDEGRPLEIQLLLGLRNLGLGLAALSLWPRCARLSAAVSLCVMLFAHVVDENNSPWLLGLFAIAGGAWLVFSYQARFSMFVAATVGTPRVVRREPKGISWRMLIGACAVLFLPVLIWAVRPDAPLFMLGEWIGSSGGTGGEDPFARGGVNNGQNEVGGENPETAGFAETDKFLDSDAPTLYDAASDLYGEPARKRKNQQQRMISVTPSDVREIKNHAETHRASREFSAARKSPKRLQKRPDDRSARALFEVKGRTPLHLRMDVFARYDGASWQASSIEPCPDLIEPTFGKFQMKVKKASWGRELGPTETHQLKIATLQGSMAPTPSLLSTFRVGLIDRHDFFEWRRDGVLGFRGRETIPSGTTIETRSQTADLLALERTDLATSTPPTYLDLAAVDQQRYAAIAMEWAQGCPQGPAQIAAIIERLRTRYQHNRASTVATNEWDPVLEFLENKQAGPDYLFASAAVLLLRSQGYPARLGFGYYAAPEDYDTWTRHTLVREDDLHFWPEIMLASGDWLVLEPTPGYHTLLPAPTIAQRLTSAAMGIAHFAAKHPILLMFFALSVLAAATYRREIADAYRVLCWRVFPATEPRSRVLATLQIIEQRAALFQKARREQQTLSQWGRQFPVDTPSGQLLHEFIAIVQAAAYSPHPPSDRAIEICSQTQRIWTVQRFRRLSRRQNDSRWPLNATLLFRRVAS